jgi:hypothetical protein
VQTAVAAVWNAMAGYCAVFNTNGTSPTATEPASCANGDYVVALYITAAAANPTLPAGWTTLYPRATVGTSFQYIVGGIQRTGSAPSYAFTHTGNVYRELHVLCFQGAATVTLDSQSSAGTTANSSADVDPPATTAVQTTSLAVTGAVDWSGSTTTWANATGYTIRSDNSAGNDGMVESKALSASGSENPSTITGRNNGGGSSDKWNGFTITLTDAGGAATCTPTLSLLGVGRCG